MTRPWQLTQVVRLVRAVLDLAALSTAHYLAFVVRFEGAVPAAELDAFAYSLPVVLLIQYLCLMACRVPESSWRYVSLLEVRRIVLALTMATAVLGVFIWSADLLRPFLPTINSAIPPRGVIVLDLLLGLVGLIGLRVSVRARYERRAR